MERNEIDFTATALATTADSIRGNRAAVDAFWTLASGNKIALNRLFYGIPICCVGFAESFLSHESARIGLETSVDCFNLMISKFIALRKTRPTSPVRIADYVVCRNEVALFNSQLDRLVTFGDLDLYLLALRLTDYKEDLRKAKEQAVVFDQFIRLEGAYDRALFETQLYHSSILEMSFIFMHERFLKQIIGDHFVFPDPPQETGVGALLVENYLRMAETWIGVLRRLGN